MTDSTDMLRALSRLTDEQLADLEELVGDAAYLFAHELVVEMVITVGIPLDPLPDDIAAAVQSHYDPLLDAIDDEKERRTALRFLCLDCQVDTSTIGQYPYLCPDELWNAVVPGGEGMLCLDCLARRLDAAGLPWPATIRLQQHRSG